MAQSPTASAPAMLLIFILSAGYLVAEGSEGSDKSADKRKGRDGWGPGGWETRNGVSSYGWDSRKPISCPRCGPQGEYRGNGYDNLSPEWQQREQGKHWIQGAPGGDSDGTYGDKRVWSGTIRPIDEQPGGLVTNWMGGPSRWRDPWAQRGVQYWHGGGYAGGYGYTQGSSFGYEQAGDNKPTTYYDRSRGEAGYISRYDTRPWEDSTTYARGWDYYEQRPGTVSGGGYTYRPPAYDRNNVQDCNPCRQRPQELHPIRPAGGCCGHRAPAKPQTPYGDYGVQDYRNNWYNRQDYDNNRPAVGYGGRDEVSTGWNTYRPSGDYGRVEVYEYGRPAAGVTRPSPASYGKPSEQNRPWVDPGRPNPDYGRPPSRPSTVYGTPSTRPSTDYGRPVSRPNTDYGRPAPDLPRPDYSRPNPDYGKPSPDYGRPNPDYARPNPDYGRPNHDYGRPNPDYGRPVHDNSRPNQEYGRPIMVSKPSPAEYGRPSPDYQQLPPISPDYGRPPPDYSRPQPDYGRPVANYGKPLPDYGRPSPDYGRPVPDYGRPPADYGRPPTDYGRPPTDIGRPSPDYGRPDYGRPPPDYGAPPPDYSRPAPDYGRPGCSTCRPDPDRPGPEQAGGYPRPGTGYGSSGGFTPAASSGGYGGSSSDGGSYPAVSGGGSSYGAVRPDDPRRDEQGVKSPLDRYPGHTGVGATFEFDTDRKQGTYYYDNRSTTSRPSTTTADHSTTQSPKQS